MNDDDRNAVIAAAVALLLEVRKQYLAAGANPLRHWDQILSAWKVASRINGTIPGFFAQLCKGLRLGAPSSSVSLASETLRTAASGCAERLAVTELNRMAAAILARARVVSEARRDARDKEIS